MKASCVPGIRGYGSFPQKSNVLWRMESWYGGEVVQLGILLLKRVIPETTLG